MPPPFPMLVGEAPGQGTAWLPGEAKCSGCWFKLPAVKMAGAVLPTQGSRREGRNTGTARGSRGPDTAGPGRASTALLFRGPGMLHPPGAPRHSGYSRASRSGMAFQGLAAADSPQPAVAPPRSEQSSNETEPTGAFPSLARSGAMQTRPRLGVRGKPDGPGRLHSSCLRRGAERPHSPHRKGPGPAAL